MVTITRRRVVCILLLVVLLCPLLVSIGAAESVRIPGWLLISGFTPTGSFSYFLHSTSDNVVPTSRVFDLGDVAPHSGLVTYSQLWGATDIPDGGDIWVSSIDGSDPINVTLAGGVGGINCRSRWSPDGSMIAFHHSDRQPDELPCESGFHVWVMDSDGSNAHRVTEEGSEPTWFPNWSPNGYRILCEEYGLGAITIGVDGEDWEFVPDVNGEDADWSANGRKLVSSWIEEGEVDGEPGIWRSLRLADEDGSDPEVLVEQFIKDSDVWAHIDEQGFDMDEFDWFTSIRALAGPLNPEWSPVANKIAFLAALPFDPHGEDYRYQTDVWLYDIPTETLTRLTDDSNAEVTLSWNGPNTFPDFPDVTVDSTTVSFEQVQTEGLTTLLLDTAPPPLPAGWVPAGGCYDTATTAGVTGVIGLSAEYQEADIPAQSQGVLALLEYDAVFGNWLDVTNARDTEDDVIYGTTDSLARVQLAMPVPEADFPDVPATGLGPAGLHPYWAFWEIAACVEAEIVSGYEDGAYHPSDPVTRDQMAVYIARALSGGEDNVPAGPPTATFDDVPTTNWAYDHVEYCYDQNVVQGYTTTTYAPTAQVTRDQMAVYVARALVAPTGEAALADYVPDDPRNFPDVASDFWAYTHIEYCVEHGVVQGYLDGSYHPTDVVTRDQMAVYVARAFGLLD